MVNQGLSGAIIQFFTIEDKPRLDRRNTWFEDHQISESVAINFFKIFFSVVITLVIFQGLGLL